MDSHNVYCSFPKVIKLESFNYYLQTNYFRNNQQLKHDLTNEDGKNEDAHQPKSSHEEHFRRKFSILIKNAHFINVIKISSLNKTIKFILSENVKSTWFWLRRLLKRSKSDLWLFLSRFCNKSFLTFEWKAIGLKLDLIQF